MMSNGWEESAGAWVRDQGEEGDFARRWVLDELMLRRAVAKSTRTALDVGCGEGRFVRKLAVEGISVVGVDPTAALIDVGASKGGSYVRGVGEQLPFRDQSFDLVVSYLSLIDIDEPRGAIGEMARVLKPGGRLLAANLQSFNTSAGERGWVRDLMGRKRHFPVDHYLEERSFWMEYRGIRVINHHRPMKTYMQAFLDAGLRLTYFDEPVPMEGAPEQRAKDYCRAPWLWVMEWAKA